MANADKVTIVLLSAAVGVAIYRFFNLSDKEKKEFYDAIKDRAQLLLRNTDETVETVKQYVSQMDAQPKGALADKLLIGKKLLTALFGSEKPLVAY
jgi:hypothetical protein